MKIKDLARKWPPVADDLIEPVTAATEDVIFSARKFEDGEDQISLKLCKPDGTEYMAILELSDPAAAKALIILIAEKNLTLEQAGDIDIL